MRSEVNTTMDSALKGITLPFIGRCLKRMGMKVQRDGDSYYVDLGFKSKLAIRFRSGWISVAVVMSADSDEIDEQLFLASMTMASTMLTKVFLNPDGDEMYIWFSAECFCKTRGEFEGVFDALFKQLMKSVRRFVKIRDSIARVKQAESIAAFMVHKNAEENQQVS